MIKIAEKRSLMKIHFILRLIENENLMTRIQEKNLHQLIKKL